MRLSDHVGLFWKPLDASRICYKPQHGIGSLASVSSCLCVLTILMVFIPVMLKLLPTNTLSLNDANFTILYTHFFSQEAKARFWYHVLLDLRVFLPTKVS